MSAGDILQASDDLSRVINSYKNIVEGQPINGDSEDPRSTAGYSETGRAHENMIYNQQPPTWSNYYLFSGYSTDTTDTLIDLTGLDTTDPPQPDLLPSQSLNPVSTSSLTFPIPVLPPPPKHLTGSHGSQSSSPSHPPLDKASTSLSFLDDELLSLGRTAQISLLLYDNEISVGQ